MKTKRVILLAIIILFLITQLTGCSKEKNNLDQISPLDKNRISIISISFANSVTKNVTDKELIDTLLRSLDKIKFSKMSIKQEEEVFQERKILNLGSTYLIQLMEQKMGISQADIIVISEKELLLVDSETMRNSRTVLYTNQNDESSLNSVKEIYLLVKEAVE